MPAIETRPEPLPLTRTTGYGRSGPRSWHTVGSSTARPRPRGGSRHRAPPRCFYPRPGLFLPHLDRRVVPFDRPPRGLLCQDQPCRLSSRQMPSTVYETWNSMPIRVLIRAIVHHWCAQLWASGPRSNSRSSLPIWASLSRGRPGEPFDRTPVSPRSRQARRHRSTERSITMVELRPAPARCGRIAARGSSY